MVVFVLQNVQSAKLFVDNISTVQYINMWEQVIISIEICNYKNLRNICKICTLLHILNVIKCTMAIDYMSVECVNKHLIHLSHNMICARMALFYKLVCTQSHFYCKQETRNQLITNF